MADDDHDKKSDSVKVAIRCRPLSAKEISNNESSIIEMRDSGDATGTVLIHDPHQKDPPGEFAFDIVFGTATENIQVYQKVGKPALDSTLSGYNGTIFAYGQTGSGKSFSMTGGPGETRGIIPRVNEELFERIGAAQQENASRKFLVMCSFFEIYNEIIFDLLNPVQDRSKIGAGLQVKEHPVLGIYVKDLQEIVVTEADKLEKLMQQGTKNRAVSSTMMNATSSRSHSIFIIKVNQKDDQDTSKNVFAKLNLVDLAGSERQKGTGSTGQTLKEGANINKSLSALGNVINALVENANGKKVFVPFRNSKLTRVLQESLGGNSLCTMLAALSPAACNHEETLSTLRYANRAKAIKVTATKNEEASQISRLNVEIEELKKRLAAASTGGGGGIGGEVAEEERQEMKAKFQMQLVEMEAMINSTWEEKGKLSAEHEEQLAKAAEEQKRQAKAMEEEWKKRFRLLKEQNDLQLSVKSLLDTLGALPKKSDGGISELRSGELPRRWLATAASIYELADSLKQQQTMALVFQGAFCEDLKLWVDGEEAQDHAMRRTGARRALKKLEAFRQECSNLVGLEAQGQQRAQQFAQEVAQARREWAEIGLPALMQEMTESVAPDGADSGTDGCAAAAAHELPGLQARTLEDVGRILELIEQQAEARANTCSIAALDMQAAASLLLQGMRLVVGDAGSSGGTAIDSADEAFLRSLIGTTSDEQAEAAGEEEAQGGGAVGSRGPREGRPLHAWTAADADDSVQGTEYVLSQLVALDGLNKKRTAHELLSRPPPKFVYDVALLVCDETNFPPGLSDTWPDAREEKLDLMQQVSDAVAATLGLTAIDFDPENVLKGKQVEKTLRLLQLLCIAAARSRSGEPIAAAKRSDNGSAARGVANVDEMRRALDVMVHCMQQATALHAQQKEQPGSGHASPTRELESSYRTLTESLEEEQSVRKRQDDRIAALQSELEAAREQLEERKLRLDESRQVVGQSKSRKEELRRQVAELRAGLLQRALELAESNPEVGRLRSQLEQVVAQFGEKSQVKGGLADEVEQLAQQRIETDTQREAMEMEVKGMKLRLAQGLDGGSKQPQSEEILALQAEKQKLDVRVGTLEEKLRTIAEADDLERQRENSLLEEKKLNSSKNEDSQMQLQVIIEERDALRDGMNQLWSEKTRVDEDLQNVMEGYTHLSDRLLEKSEAYSELEEKLQQYENLLSMLQANMESNRHSPVPSHEDSREALAEPPAAAPGPPAPSEEQPNLQAQPREEKPPPPGDAASPPRPPPPPPPAPDQDGEASSHYSDEDFEELEDE